MTKKNSHWFFVGAVLFALFSIPLFYHHGWIDGSGQMAVALCLTVEGIYKRSGSCLCHRFLYSSICCLCLLSAAIIAWVTHSSGYIFRTTILFVASLPYLVDGIWRRIRNRTQSAQQ